MNATPKRSNQEAWDLVEENQRLVFWTLNRFCQGRNLPSGVTKDDLVTEAFIGAFKAARAWDPGAGKIGTYFPVCIRNALFRELELLTKGHRTDKDGNARVLEILSRSGWLEATPSISVGVEGFGHGIHGLEEALTRASEANRFEEAIEDQHEYAHVREVIASLGLDARELRILSLKYAAEWSLRRIAEELECSYETVRVTLNKVHDRIRIALTQDVA